MGTWISNLQLVTHVNNCHENCFTSYITSWSPNQTTTYNFFLVVSIGALNLTISTSMLPISSWQPENMEWTTHVHSNYMNFYNLVLWGSIYLNVLCIVAIIYNIWHNDNVDRRTLLLYVFANIIIKLNMIVICSNNVIFMNHTHGWWVDLFCCNLVMADSAITLDVTSTAYDCPKTGEYITHHTNL